MNSRISIDVDHDNQPVIKIEYKDSDDVRDKLVKKFLETFAGTSCWSSFYFLDSSEMVVHSNRTAMLRPIPPQNLPDEVKAMTYFANEVIKSQKTAMLEAAENGTATVKTKK